MELIVQGPSMEPTYKEGDRLIVSRLFYRFFRPRVGDVVVIEHPFRRLLIVKRIKEITPKGVTVAGDNPLESEDSASFGPISMDAIVGRVLFQKRMLHF